MIVAQSYIAYKDLQRIKCKNCKNVSSFYALSFSRAPSRKPTFCTCNSRPQSHRVPTDTRAHGWSLCSADCSCKNERGRTRKMVVYVQYAPSATFSHHDDRVLTRMHVYTPSRGCKFKVYSPIFWPAFLLKPSVRFCASHIERKGRNTNKVGLRKYLTKMYHFYLSITSIVRHGFYNLFRTGGVQILSITTDKNTLLTFLLGFGNDSEVVPV